MSRKGDVAMEKKKMQSLGMSVVVFLHKDKRVSMPLYKREAQVCLR